MAVLMRVCCPIGKYFEASSGAESLPIRTVKQEGYTCHSSSKSTNKSQRHEVLANLDFDMGRERSEHVPKMVSLTKRNIGNKCDTPKADF